MQSNHEQFTNINHRTTTTYYADGATKTTADPLDHRATFQYDKAGRQTVSINPLGKRTTTTYYADGQTKARINPLAIRTTQLYDKVCPSKFWSHSLPN